MIGDEVSLTASLFREPARRWYRGCRFGYIPVAVMFDVA